MPLLSIIIPVYNVELYLAECLNSFLNQTFRDFEILLVNDGSKDSSGSLCDEYATRDSRIKAFHQENGGVSAARNLGLKNATGEFITFMDPDDYLTSKDVYEKIFSVIDEDIDVIHFGFEREDIQKNYQPPIEGKMLTIEMREKLFSIFVGNKIEDFRKMFVMSPAVTLVIRRSLIDSNHIFFQPIKRTEDKLFFFDVLLSGKGFYVFSDTFYFYRMNPTSATQNYNPDFLPEMEYSQNYQKTLLVKYGIFDSVKEEFECSILYQFYSGIMNETRTTISKDSLMKILSFEKSQDIPQILSWSKTFRLIKANPLWLLIKLRMYKTLMWIYPYYRKFK